MYYNRQYFIRDLRSNSWIIIIIIIIIIINLFICLILPAALWP
jgi:hypothetical protein